MLPRVSGRSIACLVVAAAVCSPPALAAAKEARVTRIIREVKLLPNEADPKPAVVNDRVNEDTAVRTGEQSRSELTFPDLTITRLGANSLYSFNKAGRNVDLGSGSVLLRVPKDSGGGTIHTAAVSVAVTGTTLILETTSGGRSRLMLLEGAARISLVKHPKEMRNVLAGQMLDVPEGATTLPMPVNFDIDRTTKTHPLMVGFPPLPSQNLIAAAADKQRNAPPDEPVYPGQQVSGIGPIISGLGGFLPPISVGGGGGSHNPGGRGQTTPPGRGQSTPPGRGQSDHNGNPNQQTGARGQKPPPPRPKPSPSPSSGPIIR